MPGIVRTAGHRGLTVLLQWTSKLRPHQGGISRVRHRPTLRLGSGPRSPGFNLILHIKDDHKALDIVSKVKAIDASHGVGKRRKSKDRTSTLPNLVLLNHLCRRLQFHR